jgi:hypothetical protein
VDHRRPGRPGRAAPGAVGPSGPPGPPGSSGPPGGSGVLAAAQDGGTAPLALGGSIGESKTFTDTVVTTTPPGKLLVSGHLDLTADCPTPFPTIDCFYEVGLYVDRQPVPGSGHSVDMQAFTTAEQVTDLSGLASGVPAGTHHITIGYRTVVHGPSITAGAETRSWAVAFAGS